MPQRSSRATSEGRFSEDGQSFVIRRPDTAHPLVNIISLGDYGVAVAQTGAGCSWGRRPSEPVTKGSARFTRDAGGRALYLRDDRSNKAWSVGWQPLRARPDFYECVHGVGHTLITSRTDGVQAQWLVFVPYEEPLEVWRVRVKNLSKKPRTLSLWTGIEWAGRAAAAEGQTFVHDDGRVVLAKARPSTSGAWGGVFFHGVNLPTRGHALDRRALWGPYGSAETPEAMKKGRYGAGAVGREPFASLCVPFTLKPGEERSVLFTVGCAEAQSEALLKARKFQDFAQVDNAWNRTQMHWDRYLSPFSVETPDRGFNLMMNTWLKYQALSQGLWGGRGPRDARIFLPLEPSRVRREILVRASGAKSPAAPASSDVPWPVLLADYLRESGDGRLLAEEVAPKKTLWDAASAAVRELAAHSEGGSWSARFFSDWAEMVAWAVDEGFLTAREKEAARKLRVDAERRRASVPPNGHRALSARALEEACRQGRAREAWEIYGRLAPLPNGGGAAALFAPELVDAGEPSALFRACGEHLLGVRPSWKGLRVRPCLPPPWKAAKLEREFRGATYAFRFRRNSAKPAGFQEILLNGRKVAGDLLPPAFARRNEVVVTVGRAR